MGEKGGMVSPDDEIIGSYADDEDEASAIIHRDITPPVSRDYAGFLNKGDGD
jgi:hypothetical protein